MVLRKVQSSNFSLLSRDSSNLKVELRNTPDTVQSSTFRLLLSHDGGKLKLKVRTPPPSATRYKIPGDVTDGSHRRPAHSPFNDFKIRFQHVVGVVAGEHFERARLDDETHLAVVEAEVFRL